MSGCYYCGDSGVDASDVGRQCDACGNSQPSSASPQATGSPELVSDSQASRMRLSRDVNDLLGYVDALLLDRDARKRENQRLRAELERMKR